jgi:hypothetical protein
MDVVLLSCLELTAVVLHGDLALHVAQMQEAHDAGCIDDLDLRLRARQTASVPAGS